MSSKRKAIIVEKQKCPKIVKIKANKDVNNLSELIKETKIKDSTKNAIIFARCSTKHQNEDNLHGFSTQIGICQEYADNYDLNVIEIIKDTCRGHDISKLTINNILDKYEKTNIIVADPSRLSRNPTDGTNFIIKCLEKKIIFHSARHNISTLNNNELKQFVSYIFDANTESQLFSTRIKSTLSLKKKNGSHIGISPYGFQTKKINNKKNYPILKLVNNNDEKNIIQLIIMLKCGSHIDIFYEKIREIIDDENYVLDGYQGYDYILYGYYRDDDIATFLNENGILRRNKLWTRCSVNKIYQDYKKMNDIDYFYENIENEDEDEDEDQIEYNKKKLKIKK
jgi:DNA invertase Pin-like site-specific DNA recombinase